MKGFWGTPASKALSSQDRRRLMGELLQRAASGELQLPVAATYGFDAILQVLDGDGRLLSDDIVLKVGQTMWDSPAYGPFVLPANGRLQVVMRSTPEVMPAPLEVQASIFYTDWAER